MLLCTTPTRLTLLGSVSKTGRTLTQLPSAADKRAPGAWPSNSTAGAGYEFVRFDDLPHVTCPCGTSQRAFVDVADYPATIHRVEISLDARRHYHRRLTEVYYFL